jgi:hypothetical protein
MPVPPQALGPFPPEAWLDMPPDPVGTGPVPPDVFADVNAPMPAEITMPPDPVTPAPASPPPDPWEQATARWRGEGGRLAEPDFAPGVAPGTEAPQVKLGMWGQPIAPEDATLPAPPPPAAETAAAPGMFNPLGQAAAAGEASDQAELERVANLSPEQFAAEQAQREFKRGQAVQAAKDRAATDAAKLTATARTDWDERQAKLAQRWANMERKADELANAKVDDDQWYESRSDGQKVAVFMASIIGGWNAPHRGGRNTGFEAIQGLIDRNIETQKANLAHRRGLLGQEQSMLGQLYDQSGNMLEAEMTMAAAQYEAAARQFDSVAAGYDPRGTQAAGMRRAADDARARAAEAMAKARKAALDEEKTVHDMKMSEFKAGEDARHNKATEGAAFAAIGVDKARLQLERDKLAQDRANPDPKKAAELEETLARTAKLKLDTDPIERQRMLGVGGIKTKDGKPLLFRSEGEAAKIAKAKGSTVMAAQLIDKIANARKEHGFSSEYLKSDEWRQMQTDFAALQLEIKNTAELGVLAGPDMELIGRALGTTDPTEVRDITAGLETARSNLVNKLNTVIQANDPTDSAARVDVPRLAPGEAKVKTVKENLAIATAPLSDAALADKDIAKAQKDERVATFRAAVAQVAREGVNPAEASDIMVAIEQQRAAGELDAKTAARLKADAEKAWTRVNERLEAREPPKITSPAAGRFVPRY